MQGLSHAVFCSRVSPGSMVLSGPSLHCSAAEPQLHPYRFDKLNLRTTLETSGLVRTTLHTQSNCSGSAVLHSPPRPAHIIPSSHIESSLPHLTWAAAFYYYQFVSISGSKSIFCDTFWHHLGWGVQSSLRWKIHNVIEVINNKRLPWLFIFSS